MRKTALSGKYTPYPEYKNLDGSWLGNIPSHWITLPLKRVCNLSTGLTPPTSNEANYVDYESRLPWVRPEDLNEEGNATKASKFLSQIGWELMRVVPENSTLICCIGTIGKVGYIHTNVSTNQQITSASFNYAPKFNYYLVQAAREVLEETSTGNVIRILNSERLGGIPFLSVPSYEAEKISNFLDHETAKIDSLIEKQQQLIALLKEKRQAVISHAVTKGHNPRALMRDTGVEWLGEVPGHWVSCALKHYARIVDCKHITAEFFDEGIPLASISEVKEWNVNLATAKLTNEKYYLDLIGGGRKPAPGDIIYSRNATVGEAALVSEDMQRFAMGQDVCLIRLYEDVFPEYILYVLKSGVISNQLDLAMVGSTFKRINVDDIRNFSIALPPYEEQIEIVLELTRILGKYDTLVCNAEQAISLMVERRTALISAAVTGKIDVRHFTSKNGQAPKSSVQGTNNAG